MNNATTLILDEIPRLGMKLMAGNGDKVTVLPEDFERYWLQLHETTNVSMTLIHVGYYKADTTSDRVLTLLAKKNTCVTRSGCPSKLWGSGIQLMPEKIAGSVLINKLCAILLI